MEGSGGGHSSVSSLCGALSPACLLTFHAKFTCQLLSRHVEALPLPRSDSSWNYLAVLVNRTSSDERGDPDL